MVVKTKNVQCALLNFGARYCSAGSVMIHVLYSATATLPFSEKYLSIDNAEGSALAWLVPPVYNCCTVATICHLGKTGVTK